ncbi:MAG: cytochrome D1 domain-containing protein, partial [Exilibacterium sp.]
MKTRAICIGLSALIGTAAACGNEPTAASALYQKHCQQCHGSQRLGGMGPALLPENLQRLNRKSAAKVILEGRPATQMPGFSQVLSNADTEQLVNFIYRPPVETPQWSAREIAATQKDFFPKKQLSSSPVFTADPLNLFIVVEQGDHHATVLDGDTFDPIHRFKTHYALHGGPKYTSDGRFVYFASRDGWISKFDLYNLKTVAEVRAGINTRNIAVSSDGKIVAVANYLPHSLVFLNAEDLSLIDLITVKAEKSNRSSRVSAVYNAPPRNSFIAALKDIAEVWEIPYKNLRPRRIQCQDFLDDFFFDPSYRYLIGTSRDNQPTASKSTPPTHTH